ncbi:MAG: ABC transporter permease [Methylophilaceae bacterium]|nr:ABC transporter permease [Methyloradius sp.]
MMSQLQEIAILESISQTASPASEVEAKPLLASLVAANTDNIESAISEEPVNRSFKLPVWLSWFVRRLISSLAGIIVISMLVFVATQALPSDPARIILGPEAPEESVLKLQHQLGLDKSIVEQYLNWIEPALKGDFGISIDSNLPVTTLIGIKLKNSLVLLFFVLAIMVPSAFAIGVYLALHRDTALDRSVIGSLIFFKAVPSFAIALGLVMLLSTTVFNIFPAVSLFESGRSIFTQLQFMVLPTLTLILSTMPYLVRLVRGSMIEVLESEFVTAARLRGVPEHQVIWRYAIPNAIIPAIQAIALMASVLLGGALVVEVVFTYPGIGSALNSAVDIRDVPVIQAIVLFLASGVMVINLLADFATVLLTPRLRTSS